MMPRSLAALVPMLALVAIISGGLTSPGSPNDEKRIDFDRDVKPIFAKHCLACHGPDKQKGELRLDRKADALKGGDSGAAIMPGKPDASLLLKKVTSRDDDERMPPSGDPLTAAQIATLRAWVLQGAKWPEAAPATDPQLDHWAFKPIKRPAVLTSRNPVDSFILAKLGDNGLSLSPEADRRTLIRRLKFDLLGLPPTPEEVEAFVKDTSPDAYEKRVEKYLASPHYGERWARHWLDAVRFAESHGFEMNWERPNAWPYRDWVIRAFNDDMPYDRFVKAQLAGDTLGADEATGFLVGGPWDQVRSPDAVLTAQQRADELHDMVGTTGSAFLGLTVGCARCHDHKFDPVPQTDYYRLKAVFAGVQHGDRLWQSAGATTTDPTGVREGVAKLDAALATLDPPADPLAKSARRLPVNPRMNVERFAPVTTRAVRFVILTTNNREPCLDELEVFTAGANPRNVAAGVKPRSSGDWPGAPDIHRLEFLTDGKYGNARSWISSEIGLGWIVVEFPQEATIDRVVWGRDREGKYLDRLPLQYRVEVRAGDQWLLVASSDDRLPFGSPAIVPPALAPADRDAWERLSVQQAVLRQKLADLERRPMVYAGRFTAPEPTFRLHRGDATQNREPVGPGVLTRLGPPRAIPADATDPRRRRALAEWIVHPDNPLTARVIVNRLWQHHFGTGLVDTPSDFGRNGGRPSHPELLDWLASELVNPTILASRERKRPEEGTPPVAYAPGSPWSLKHLHRLIVTSATYRQSSAATPIGTTKDAQTRLLWRYPPRRLEAEAIRDSILLVSGKLNLQMGGLGFSLFEPNANYVRVHTPRKEFGPAEFRRMVYMHKTRMQLDDTFGPFDCPDAGQIAPKRNASTTPLQSLNLLNSTFMLRQADYFAARVEAETSAPLAQVRRVFRLAFQREPSAAESNAAMELVEKHGLAALCRAVLNANEFLYLD